MAELPRYELVRRAGANRANGVEVPRVVDPVMRDDGGDESRAVDVAAGLSIQSSEESLAGRDRPEVLLDVWPRPFRDSHDAIARVCFCSARTHFASFGVDVGLDTPKGGGDLDTCAIEQREESAVWTLRAVDNATDISQRNFDGLRPVLWRRFHAARDVDLEYAGQTLEYFSSEWASARHLGHDARMTRP